MFGVWTGVLAFTRVPERPVDPPAGVWTGALAFTKVPCVVEPPFPPEAFGPWTGALTFTNGEPEPPEPPFPTVGVLPDWTGALAFTKVPCVVEPPFPPEAFGPWTGALTFTAELPCVLVVVPDGEPPAEVPLFAGWD